MTYQTVHFYESGYEVRTIQQYEEQAGAYRLRHRIFCETLNWVPPNPGGLEIDRYDQWAILLGVFSEMGILVGLARFLPPDRPFMLEADFAELLVPGNPLRKENNSVELSRLAVIPTSCHRREGRRFSAILYKGIYQWSLANKVRYIYMVVEVRFWRALLLAGFPCEPIGPVKRLPPGNAKSVAAVLDWEAFRYRNRAGRPAFLDWMGTVRSAPAPSPAPRHVLASGRRTLQEYSSDETAPSAR